MRSIDARYMNISKAFVNAHKLSKDEYFEQVFETAFELIPEAQKGSFYELVGDMYCPLYSKGYDLDLLKKLSFPEDKIFIDYGVQKDDIVQVNQVKVVERQNEFSDEIIEVFKALGTYENFISLYAPIKYKSHVVGLLCLENFDDEYFSKDSQTVLEIYAQFISHFYSMKLYQEEIETKHLDIINALVSAVEAKDAYTEGHSLRVMEMSVGFAKFIKLPEVSIRRIRECAILHDVGKVGIPINILNKNGPLTDEEYEVIKSHPELGAKILSKIQDFDDIIKITRAHHEHYNGRGYPDGLKGDEIPYEAQLITLVDAFDAMTSKRPYREPMSLDVAIQEIKKCKGEQFNPSLVESFLEYIHILNNTTHDFVGKYNRVIDFV